MSSQKQVYRLTESALMIAIAAVLSVIKIVDMPVGGSVTLLSMLPIVLIAYRYGTGWGLLTGFAYGLVQLLLGLDNLTWAPSFGSAATIILFDYVVAFTVLGLGGVFRHTVKSQGAALALGAVLTGGLRYLCHVITGYSVWYDLSAPTAIPSAQSLSYSFVYNGVYMVPEILLLAVGALYLSRLLNFRETTITRAAPAASRSPLATQLSVASVTALFAAIIADIVLIVPNLQTEEELFSPAGFAQVDWVTVGIITVLAVAVAAICTAAAKKIGQKDGI